MPHGPSPLTQKRVTNTSIFYQSLKDFLVENHLQTTPPHCNVQILFFFFHLFNLFIFGCIGTSLLCTGFLQLLQVGATLHCSAQASHCSGFSCCRARALGAWASVVVARGLSSCSSWALEHRLSSCGARAQLLRGMWDLPGPGLEPVFPALAGRFLTTAPPGKLLKCIDSNLILQMRKPKFREVK